MTSLSSHSRGRVWLPRLRAILTFQRSKHTEGNGGNNGEFCTEMGSGSLTEPDNMKSRKWKKHDARTLGVTRGMISSASWTVVKLLQTEGYEAYLVGGCVRDLILKRSPKDFDVITTACLPKIRRKFHRSIIIGQKFPICRVNIGGSYVEVSSFDTALATKGGMKKNKILTTNIPDGCDERDMLLWRNSMDRDFTINSLFYDPFVHKIYDYSNSLKDLKALKLRTLLPAQTSFKEDCARILRGLRLAARLNLSFAKETETAIQKLSSSILSLPKSRLFMEVNYMLSYGAAERSLGLLKRYHLLEFLLPIHNAYLTEEANIEPAYDSMMLMKLFSNLDLLVGCDRPSDSSLWVAILAFHTALIKDPQEALVVLAFASLLYHGNWEKGISHARGYIDAALRYDTEILDSGYALSDDELAERVTKFTTLVKDSIAVLTSLSSLRNAMVNFPDFKSDSGLVFVSQRMGSYVEHVFDTLVKEGVSITSLNIKRKNFEIDYVALGKGDICETSFVLGKIIIDTMIPAGNLGKDQISMEKDGRDEIKPGSVLELSGSKKPTGDHCQNVIPILPNILKEKICPSPQDEFQDILGDVILESRNDDRNNKVELNHAKGIQLSARKQSNMLEKCNDQLARKQGTSMSGHHFLEEESVEENKITVVSDQNAKRVEMLKTLAILGEKRKEELNRNRLTSEQNSRMIDMKKVLAILGRSKKEELIHDKSIQFPAKKHSKMLKKGREVVVEKQEHHFPGEKGVEENKIVVDRDEPNLDCTGSISEWNAEHNLKNAQSKKVLTRLDGSKKEELIHDKSFQFPAKKHLKKLKKRHDLLVKKKETSMQEHHFPGEKSIEENEIVVDQDEPNLDCTGPTSERNAEHNLKNVESNEVLTRHGGSKKKELIQDERHQLPAKKHLNFLDEWLGILVTKQGTSTQEQHSPEEEHVEKNKIVVDRDEPNLDRRGPTSDGNAKHNFENDQSKKAVSRLSSLF